MNNKCKLRCYLCPNEKKMIKLNKIKWIKCKNMKIQAFLVRFVLMCNRYKIIYYYDVLMNEMSHTKILLHFLYIFH